MWTWCISDRASWIDYILITNLMHRLLFIHKIIFSSTCFEDRLCGLVVRVSGYRYRGLGFDSRRCQIFLSSSGSGTGFYSASWASWGQLRSYLNKKSSGSRSRKQRLTAVGTRCADHVTPLYPQKLALNSPTGGGRSVGIVRSRTKATEFSFSFLATKGKMTHVHTSFHRLRQYPAQTNHLI